MSDAPETELEQALADLEAKGRGRAERLSRWDARAVLVPLGRLALARGPEGVRAQLERIAAATAGSRDAWSAAVREELSLACAEHVQGTDPRYVGLPSFDWAYVLHARERLEARIVAARCLGVEPPAVLSEAVERADERVRAHRPSAGGSGGS